MPQFLALPPLGDGEDGASIVRCGCLIRSKEVQPAGHAFFEIHERSTLTPSASPSPSESEDEDQNGKSSGTQSPDKKKSKAKGNKDAALKLHDLLKGVDLYGLMDCEEGCSQEDLKKAYRSMCLVHHPDKQHDKTPKQMEKINKHFLKIQEGYEVLSDPKKRRKYDSMGDFDEFVPAGLKKNQDFFTVFGPVFKRNAKWSERKPVPDLGDEQTPWDTVEKFYDFWREFETWRDMDEKVKEEEGDDCFAALDDAECREERRWMERENEKLRGKYRKVERQRVLKLVANAEQCDPRVKVEKDRKWASFEAAKAEKEAKRLEAERLAKDEEERRAAVERQLEEKKRLEKEEKAKANDAKKKARASLRKRVSGLQLNIMEDQLQDFFLTLEQNEIQSLEKSLAADPKAEKVFDAMREKSFEPIIVQKVEETSTADEDSSQEEEVPAVQEDPAVRAEKERAAAEKRKEAALREKEDKKRRQEEAVINAKEKEIRDAKKKVDQEKREVERKKAEKKEVERQKKAGEKAEKDAQKALDKAVEEKQASRQRAEQQSEKHRIENEAEVALKAQEARQMALDRDRSKRADALEKMEWGAVVEFAREESVKPAVASLIAAANKREGEDRTDAQLASLGGFFILGVRPSQDSPVLSSNLRNRVKKLRTRLRASAADFVASVSEAIADEPALDKILAVVIGGIVEEPEQVPSPPQLEPATASKKKPKAKAKPAEEEEDLDSLLKEFNVPPAKSKKTKKK